MAFQTFANDLTKCQFFFSSSSSLVTFVKGLLMRHHKAHELNLIFIKSAIIIISANDWNATVCFGNNKTATDRSI